MGRRDVLTSSLIGVGVAALGGIGPFCVAPVLGLLAIPVCALAEMLLVAGLVLRVSKPSSAATVVAALVTTFATFALFYVTHLSSVVLPVAVGVAGLGLRASSARSTLLLGVGVALAVVGLAIGLEMSSTLLLAARRGNPAPATWVLDAVLTFVATAIAFLASWWGLAQGPSGGAARLAVLVASIPAVGAGGLFVYARAFGLVLST